MDSRVRRRWHFLWSVRRPSYRSRAMLLVVGLILGLVLGAAGAWLWARGRTAALEVDLSHERSRAEEKVALLEQAKQEFSTQLGYRFDALAADALRKNNESFLEL